MKKKETFNLTQSVLDREKNTIEALSRIWKCEYKYAGKDVFSRVDGFMFKEDTLKAIFEIKCRNQSLSWFRDYKSCMVSYNKIQIGSDISRLLKVKFFIIIETGDRSIIVFQITDDEGKIICPMNIRHNEIEKNTNFDNVKEIQTTTTAYLYLEENKYLRIYKESDYE